MDNFNISNAVEDVRSTMKGLLQINTTLLKHYFAQSTIPSDVTAYQKQLESLLNKTEDICRLDTDVLRALIDDSDAVIAAYLVTIVDGALTYLRQFRKSLKDNHDPWLDERKHWSGIVTRLSYERNRCKARIETLQSNPYRRKAYERMPQRDGQNICKGAIKLINGDDRGEICAVSPTDLLKKNKLVLKEKGGRYLWWKCPDCKFKIRFHVNGTSTTTTTRDANAFLSRTSETRSYQDIPLKWRTMFLARSHLYLPSFNTTTKGSNPPPRTYCCIFCLSSHRRPPPPPPPPTDYHHHLQRVIRPSFFFDTGVNLAEHISQKHSTLLPPTIMLDKMNAAVGHERPIDGRIPDIWFPKPL